MAGSKAYNPTFFVLLAGLLTTSLVVPAMRFVRQDDLAALGKLHKLFIQGHR